MSLFHAGLQPALDSDGNPISGATWNFYLTGTTTPAAVYSSNSLAVELGSSVTANSAGRFAVMFLDDDVTYRAILKDAGGGTIKDIDPINPVANNVITVDQYGALGDGSTDDYAAIVAAQTALVALGGGELLFTHGKTYLVDTPIPMENGITYKGTGSSGINQVYTRPGAKIMAGGTAAFINSADTRHEIKFENLFLHSEPGGGHIFDWSLGGVTAKIEFEGCTLIQQNTDKHIILGTAAAGVFSIWVHDCDWQYQNSNTVAPMNFYNINVNSIVFERCWSTCTYDTALPAPSIGTYSIYMESSNPAGSCFNCIVRDVVFEVPIGGSVKMLSANESGVENCTVYDLFVPSLNEQFHIDVGTAGYASANCWLKGVRSQVGSASKPDVFLNCSIAGQSAFIIENCAIEYLDGGNATPGILIKGSTINNFQNIAYTRLGASATLDLHFGTTDASSKSYAFWNGYSGNNQGYLNIDQNGSYVGAVNPLAGFQWGGSILSPNFKADADGTTTATSYKVGANQVVGARGAAVADATDAASAITQLNTLLARLRTHGLIAT